MVHFSTKFKKIKERDIWQPKLIYIYAMFWGTWSSPLHMVKILVPKCRGSLYNLNLYYSISTIIWIYFKWRESFSIFWYKCLNHASYLDQRVWAVKPKVIKIPIRILKSYDFTIQHYENNSNLNWILKVVES